MIFTKIFAEISDHEPEEEPEVKPDVSPEKPLTYVKFGPNTTKSIAIDASLNKLFNCFEKAYK